MFAYKLDSHLRGNDESIQAPLNAVIAKTSPSPSWRLERAIDLAAISKSDGLLRLRLEIRMHWLTRLVPLKRWGFILMKAPRSAV